MKNMLTRIHQQKVTYRVGKIYNKMFCIETYKKFVWSLPQKISFLAKVKNRFSAKKNYSPPPDI